MELIIKIIIIFTFGLPLFFLFSIISSYYNTPNRTTPEWVKEGDTFFTWLFS